MTYNHLTKQLPASSVALVYDQATTAYGGAELVLTQLHALFPEAPLFTLIHDARSAVWTKGWDIRTSGLQKLYSIIRRHEPLTVLAPLAIESLSEQLKPYDLIISVSAGAAKGIQTLPHQLHVCYLLTPTRYLTQESAPYLNSYPAHRLASWLKLDRPIKRYLARWDMIAAHRPDRVVAISELVKRRILKHYQIEADAVVYPPIPQPASRFGRSTTNAQYFLCISRLVWYKRIDLAIQAVLETPQLPMLVIIGTGVSENQLQKIAGLKGYSRTNESVDTALKNARKQKAKIVFLGACSEVEKNELLQQSAGLIMPGIEDYGLTAVEAASYGIPSVISAESGVAEILTTPKLAIHLKEQSVDELAAAMAKLLSEPSNTAQLKKQATAFVPDAFITTVAMLLTKFWSEHTSIHSRGRTSLIQSAG